MDNRLMPRLAEFLNEGIKPRKKTFKYVEDSLLRPLATHLGRNLEYLGRKVHKDMGEKVVQKFYRIGNTTVMLMTTRPAGRKESEVELYLMSSDDATPESRYMPASNYSGFVGDLSRKERE